VESAFLTAIGLLAGAVLLPFVLFLVHRSPASGLYVMTAPLVVDLVVDLPVTTVAGFNVDLTRDVAGILLLVVGVYRLVNGGRPLALWIVSVFSAVFIVALVRGITTYGLSGHLEFSGTFLLLAGVAYGSSFQLTDNVRSSVLRALLWISVVLLAVTAAIWTGLGGADTQIPAPVALVIAQTGVLYGVAGLERTRASTRLFLVAGLLIGFAVLMQHRSVWVVVLAAIVGMAVMGARRSPRLVAVLAAIAVLGMTAQSVGFTSGRAGFEAESLAESMQMAAVDDRTWEWRQEYWRYTFETHRARGSSAMAVGAGYGAPWISFGPLVDRLEGPHNQYVDFLVRFGILGVVGWLTLLAWATRSLWRLRSIGSYSGLSNGSLLLLLLTQVVWSTAYWMDQWQPLLLGLVIAACVDARTDLMNTTDAMLAARTSPAQASSLCLDGAP
jgi:O-antigen ligase